ncbi:MAG TPA: hypothetical protein VFG55_08105 [Rhodanobacteraceae bacterium]|nr:hypothetical protein [Rhodanobacteraceae bacterium]
MPTAFTCKLATSGSPPQEAPLPATAQDHGFDIAITLPPPAIGAGRIELAQGS